MKILPAFPSMLRGLIALGALPAIAQAHPGHDGHELTWDLGHLAAYPAATLMWVLGLTAGIWGLSKLAHLAGEAVRTAAATERRNRRR